MQVLSAISAPLPNVGLYALDVRSKMLVSVLASVATVCISSLEGQMVLVVASLGYALSMRRFLILLWAYVFIAVMYLLAIGCTEIMHSMLPVLMRDTPFSATVLPFLRLLVMVHVVLPLALSCRIQNVLDALRGLRLPFWLYLPAAVTIRFIPIFIHDVAQVAESLRLRGHEPGLKNMLLHPVLTLRLMFAPLLFRSLRTSEDLGIAAELKGLGQGGVMVSYRKSRWGIKESALVVLTLLVFMVAVLVQWQWGSAVAGGMR